MPPDCLGLSRRPPSTITVTTLSDRAGARGATHVYCDLDRDRAADLVVVLAGDHPLAAADFGLG